MRNHCCIMTLLADDKIYIIRAQILDRYIGLVILSMCLFACLLVGFMFVSRSLTQKIYQLRYLSQCNIGPYFH